MMRRALPLALLVSVAVQPGHTAFAMSLAPGTASRVPPATIVRYAPQEVITPENGGTVAGLQAGDVVTFPAQAVPSEQNVSVDHLDEVPAQIVADVVMLDQFSLIATDRSGKQLNRFRAPWSADFGFGKCTGQEGCLWDVVDQATIRCMYLDEKTSEWLALDSRTDVIGDRLYCTSAFAGAFAIVGDFPETSDTGSGRALFLPTVLR